MRLTSALLLLALAAAPRRPAAQTPAAPAAAAAQAAVATPAPTPASAASLPTFEVATIKPDEPGKGGMMGFYSYPGGRVLLGAANLSMLLYFAYNVDDYQISGVPDWANSERYEIVALPPESSPSRSQRVPMRVQPTDEQRQMIQSLLRDRYHLQFHTATRQGEVYILSRGSKPLQLHPPKDPDESWRGAVVSRGGGIYDGEAFGQNISMASLAGVLKSDLHLPVLDQTGISGTYDFHIDPFDPENTDVTTAVFGAIDRLGLKLKRATGPIETLVVDHIERPSEN